MTCKECDSPAKALGLCNKHYLRLRRSGKTESQVKKGNQRQKIGDMCRNGHVIDGDNVNYRWRKGEYHYLCRTCELDRHRRKNGNAIQTRASTPKDLLKLRGIREEAEALAKSIGIDLRTITIKPRAQKPWRDFQEARAKTTDYNCYNREAEFIDYDEPPTNPTALCSDCPLFNLCENYSKNEQPGWGVWAGKTYGDYNKEEGE